MFNPAISSLFLTNRNKKKSKLTEIQIYKTKLNENTRKHRQSPLSIFNNIIEN